jgi:indole-3-glycerol phosphate synthase
MATYLDRILAAHRATAAADRRRLDDLVEQARRMPPARSFGGALSAASGRLGGPQAVAVIAEVKRRSPSKGVLAADLDPGRLAKQYAAGGAACLSVLTDHEFFGGGPDDLVQARLAAGLPVLRKDFTVCDADVCDARLMGADAVLLIAAALSRSELARLTDLAASVGLEALVEVHDLEELDTALAAGATLIGVNQRDLVTFEVDTGRAERVVAAMPADVVRIAESGITTAADARRLAGAGFDAILVGESLVRSMDPSAAVAALRGA